MLHHLIDILLHNQNQFASGGMLLMALGAMGASLRKVPHSIWDWIVRQTTLQAEIVDECRAFEWFRYWYLEQRHNKKSRRVDLFGSSTLGPTFNLAPGRHWFWYGGRPLVIRFTRSDEKKNTGWTAKRAESLSIRTIGRDQEFLRRLSNDMFTAHERYFARSSRLYLWSGDEWIESPHYTPRTLDSVILPEKQKERIVRDIQIFQMSEEWYKEVGVPYHRGHLYYGPPGTGKTSLILGLAHKFGANVYYLKLSSLTDGKLMEAVSHCNRQSFVVLEDVDCAQATSNRDASQEDSDKKSSKRLEFVTLSGLLNVIDGMEAPYGVIFFMTTNKLSSLDPALIRPGRADVREEFCSSTLEQREKMYARFFPDSVIPKAGHTDSTPAEFQEYLIGLRNSRIVISK